MTLDLEGVCEHHDCRCAAAAELAAIAERTGLTRFLAMAVAVHEQRVVCRRALDAAEGPGA